MKTATIAFYNTENFFNDGDKLDDSFIIKGNLEWNRKRYEDKVQKISEVISVIGVKETGEPPLFIGLAEIEGKSVLKDLVSSEYLFPWKYDYIHFDSKDERGIDTALLYRKEHISIIEVIPIRESFTTKKGRIDFTRDVLYVKFELEKGVIHSFIIHLPSRRDNNTNSEFRNSMLRKIRAKVEEILEENPDANIVLMGDFNGNPNDEFSRSILKSTPDLEPMSDELYNPMLTIGYGVGTMLYDGRWQLFDQMLFSKHFLSAESTLKYQSTHIYNSQIISEQDGKCKGAPFRTFAGIKYLGGYSDHFPVFAILNY